MSLSYESATNDHIFRGRQARVCSLATKCRSLMSWHYGSHQMFLVLGKHHYSQRDDQKDS